VTTAESIVERREAFEIRSRVGNPRQDWDIVPP